MPIEISSPHRYQERITAYGYEGVGKSTLIHSVLKYQRGAHAYIIDLDYSYSHDRLIETEYPENEDRAHIFAINTDWDEFGETFDQILREGDPERGDWLVIDPATVTWDMAQNWYSDKVHGEDLADHLVEVRRQNEILRDQAKTHKEKEDAKNQYFKDTVEEMTWPLINKIYKKGFYEKLHRWRGNFILVCEADSLPKNASAEDRDKYGFIGHKPKGQKTLPFAARTNIYLFHPDRETWMMTTVKDGGRELVERYPIKEFAIDYLVEIAGWEQTYVK